MLAAPRTRTSSSMAATGLSFRSQGLSSRSSLFVRRRHSGALRLQKGGFDFSSALHLSAASGRGCADRAKNTLAAAKESDGRVQLGTATASGAWRLPRPHHEGGPEQNDRQVRPSRPAGPVQGLGQAMDEARAIKPNLDYPAGPTSHLKGFDPPTFTPILVASHITG